jgi:ADP-ribose pyrophosphatase YjhB (NUDIX family)
MQKKNYCYHCGAPLEQLFIEGKVRPYCPQCREPIYENPVPATSLIVTDSQNALLLVKRSVEPKIGYWCLPGGFIELGEAPDQAALRELKEETGLSGKIDRLLGVTSDTSDRYGTILMVGYRVKEFSGILKPGDDASAVAYFMSDDLPEIAFSSHRHFIRKFYRPGPAC